MRPEIEISSLCSPGVRFSDNMFRGGDVFPVILPIIGIITSYLKDGKLLHQERTAFIRPSSVVPCGYHAGISFDSVPCPSLFFSAPDVTP